MSTKTGFSTECTACVPGALPGGLARTSFFNGMFLTQADLENEQRYWRMKRRLTNRALGQGVVWGLRLAFDEQTRRYQIAPGYALDCCGNDLVVPCKIEIKETELLQDQALADLLAQARQQGKGFDSDGIAALLVLQYVECPEEPRPVHKDPCSPDPSCCEPSRMRETTRFLLVPPRPAPKPGPLEDFAQGLDELRSKLVNPALASFFPDSASFAWDAGGSANPTFPLQLRVGMEAQEVMVPVVQGTAPDVAPVFAVVRDGVTTTSLTFELVPDRGLTFYDGEAHVGGPSGLSVSKLTAPFDLHLAWSWTIDLTTPPLNDSDQAHATTVPFTFSITNLGWTPLFEGQRLKLPLLTVSGQIVYMATKVEDGKGRAVHCCVEDLAALADVAPVADPAPEAAEADCAGAMLNMLMASAAGTARANAPATLVLAALYAWLGNSLRGLDPSAANYDGRRIAATWIYLAAWRLLFGANAAGADDAAVRAQFANLLQSLFSAWCSGVVYPGPHCTSDDHGVVLGTVTLANSGAVARVDPWDGRRHVLLGPLVTHWAGRFGLPPLDVAAARLYRWVCCVADIDPQAALPALPAGTADAFTSKGDLTGVALDATSFGTIGGDLTDSVLFAFGDPSETEGRLKKLGRTIVGSEQVSIAGFVAKLVGSLGGPPPAAGDGRYLRVSLKHTGGIQLHLYLPAPAATAPVAERSALHGAVAELVRQILATIKPAPKALPPIARPAVVDFLTVLPFHIPLTKAGAIDLGKLGLVTLGDVLAAGPEGVARQLGANGATPLGDKIFDTANATYLAAEVEMRELVNSVYHLAADFKASLFSRPGLLAETFLKDLAEQMEKPTGMPDDQTRAAAMCAAEQAVLMGALVQG